MNEDGIIRPKVGIRLIDGIDRIRAVITDDAAFATDCAVGSCESKGDGNGCARRHREGNRHLMRDADRVVGWLSHHRALPCEADEPGNGLVVFGYGNDMLLDCAEHPSRRQSLLCEFNGDGLIPFPFRIIVDDDGVGY